MSVLAVPDAFPAALFGIGRALLVLEPCSEPELLRLMTPRVVVSEPEQARGRLRNALREARGIGMVVPDSKNPDHVRVADSWTIVFETDASLPRFLLRLVGELRSDAPEPLRDLAVLAAWAMLEDPFANFHKSDGLQTRLEQSFGKDIPIRMQDAQLNQARLWLSTLGLLRRIPVSRSAGVYVPDPTRLIQAWIDARGFRGTETMEAFVRGAQAQFPFFPGTELSAEVGRNTRSKYSTRQNQLPPTIGLAIETMTRRGEVKPELAADAPGVWSWLVPGAEGKNTTRRAASLFWSQKNHE